MNKFLIKYASGLTSEITCGLESVEAFCNQHFGSTWDDAKAAGASVVIDAKEAIAEVAAEVKVVAAEVVAEVTPVEAPHAG